ncbi:MAG: hypothetical protein FWG13_01575 [Leptospirales bacterium]|nr:hypothetical protein [Leptospirales bacterium]
MMKTPPFRLIVYFLSAILLSGLESSAGVEEPRADWNKNTVTTLGTASMRVEYGGTPVSLYDGGPISITEARRAAYETAKDIAMEKMVSVIKNMRIDQDNTLGNMLEQESFTRQKLASVLNKIKYEEFSSGFDSSSCRAKLAFGDIISSLPFSFPENEFPQRLDVPIETEYTGLIIDARALAIKSMLFPVIYNKNGLEIISRRNINGVMAVKYGMLSYAFDEKEARQNKRLGKRPLYTAAIEENRNCPVLSEKDVRRIFNSPKTLKAMRECRIVFIIDRE